jgi:hypothetical protein
MQQRSWPQLGEQNLTFRSQLQLVANVCGSARNRERVNLQPTKALLAYVHVWVATYSPGLKRVAILHGYHSDAACVAIARAQESAAKVCMPPNNGLQGDAPQAARA